MVVAYQLERFGSAESVCEELLEVVAMHRGLLGEFDEETLALRFETSRDVIVDVSGRLHGCILRSRGVVLHAIADRVRCGGRVAFRDGEARGEFLDLGE